MTLDELYAAGAYMNAGFVDIYDAAANKHVRLGQLTATGDFIPTPEGEAFELPAPAVEEVKPKRGKKAADGAADLNSELDNLLGN